MRRRFARRGAQAVLAASMGCAAPAVAQQAAQIFPIPKSGITFETGDTWVQGGQRMRLYGVQACIRGTQFTNQAGVKGDCGEASLAYLAALVRDTSPSCAPVAQVAGTSPQIVVVCSVNIGGTTLDLGTILISQGFAFASFSNDAKPVYMPYLVAELTAKREKRGLWSAPDLPHPNALLLNSAANSQ